MKQFYYLSILALCMLSFTSKAQQTCYTISDSENKVYKFDLATGTILSSQSLSSLSSPEASTLNLAGDTMYILNQDQLHYIVFNSGSLSNTKVTGSDISTQTLTGALGNKTISDFDAMSVDTAGNIWAGSSNNNPCLMVVIDPSTGMVKEDFFGAGIDYLQVQNGSWPALRFDAMAFDPLTNQMYANMNGSSQNYDYLFNINKTNGVMTLVRQFNTIDDVEGMAFDAVGELYVTSGANASSTAIKNTLWHVDLINGEVTKAFSLWGGDMETCDCVIGEPISAVEVSGYVFFDENEDTTFNNGDVGKSGYLISLYGDVNGNGVYDQATDTLVDTMRTYSDGYYEFRLAYTSGADKYVLVSDTNDLPTGAFYTTDNIEKAVFTAGLQSDENNNFGFSIDSSAFFNIISGTVYGDKDEDKVLDSDENGVAGVKVRLYKDKNCNGTYENSDELIDSTVVGTNGEYSFLRSYDPDTSSSTATISKRICYKYDDAEESSGGTMYRTSSDLDFGDYWVGLRFQSIGIPQGATITSAYIQFTAESSDSESTSLKIYGEDENDADSYSSNDDDISTRTKTTAYKSWTPSSWSSGNTYNTPDLTSVVQEIVDRTGWVSGNDMAFIIKSISGDRDAYTYDNSSSKAAKLVVEYATGSSSSTDDCYLTMIDESTKPAGSYLTTDNIETAKFTSGGNHDSMNNFGLWGGSLPVEWLTFNGRYIGEEVELNWSTAMEENNSHFEVLRSADGINWEVIGEVNGAGSSNEINSYMFIDAEPHAKINYYKIKQVDFDGMSSETRIVVLEKQKLNEIGMNMYPNPATDYVEINWIKNIKNGSVVLMDMRGTELQNIELNQDKRVVLDLSNLDRGFYLVEIRTASTRFTKKLLHK